MPFDGHQQAGDEEALRPREGGLWRRDVSGAIHRWCAALSHLTNRRGRHHVELLARVES